MPELKTYNVKIPIAGHAFLVVRAEDEKSAIDAALGSDELTIECIEEWEPLRQFHHGNVSSCPTPWEAEAECDEEDEVPNA